MPHFVAREEWIPTLALAVPGGTVDRQPELISQIIPEFLTKLATPDATPVVISIDMLVAQFWNDVMRPSMVDTSRSR